VPGRAYLRLLGGARIDAGDGSASPVRGRAAHRRRLALLALLAAAPGNRLSRERILAWLWPELDSESGRRNLSEALHVLRRELGDDALVSVGDDVRLNTDVVGADIVDFRAASEAGDHERALSLYGGPFLDGWYVDGAREFDEWAEGERALLGASYARSLEVLAERHENEGDFRSAVIRWRERSRLAPDASLPVARLAAAMAAAGERADAIRLLEQHVQRLESEGIPVESPVTTLAEQLRTERDAPFDVSVRRSSPTPRVVPAVARVSRPGFAWRRRGSLIAAVAVVLLGGAAFIWARPKAAPDTVLIPDRLAVLYFDHDGRDSLGYLADGITGRLIDELSSVSALHVVSRSGVLHYRGLRAVPPLDSIARALRARLIVEGRLERRGDAVRVSVSLVDAATGTRVGGPRVVERPLDEKVVFALQDDVARELAVALRRRLGTEVQLLASRSGTTNPAAQEFFDRAEYARNTSWSLRQNGDAADLPAADRALAEADSLYALAAGRDSRWLMPVVSRGWVARERSRLRAGDSSRAFVRMAVAFANDVLARDSSNARALELRGNANWTLLVAVSGGRFEGALLDSVRRDLGRSLQLDSTRVVAAATLAQAERVTARTDDDRRRALSLARQAWEQDAFLASAEGAVNQLYRGTYALGQLDSARIWCDRGREMSPSDWRFAECPLALMRVQLRKSDPAEAWRAVRTLREMDPDAKAQAAGHPYSPTYRTLVAAAVTAAAGEQDSARAVLARALRAVEGQSDMRIDVKHDEALVRMALGDREAAMATLGEYLRHRPEFYGAVLNDIAWRQFGLDSAKIAALLPPT
jgi:DNA-binding SARP family transcriptional activator/TolB-like protein